MIKTQMVSGINKLTATQSIFFIGAILITAIGSISVFIAKPFFFFIGSISLAIVIVAFWLVKTHRDFQAIFLALFIIAFFQGFIDKIRIIFPFLPPSSLWGPLKYFLMALLLCRYLPKILIEMRLYLNSGIRLWLVVWLLNWVIFIMLVIEAMIAEPKYKPIGALQNFGMANMFLGIMVYFDSRPRQVIRMLYVFVWFGVLAALFGIIQRALGPSILSALGFDLFAPNSFAFLNSTNMETQHRDIENGLRAFSFFASHHAFSAFLIFSTLSLQIVRLQNRISSLLYMVILCILFGGFIVTFNLTNLFSCILILLLFAFLQHTQKLSAFYRFFLKKSVWRNFMVFTIIGICTLALLEPLRNRFVGIFDIGAHNPGAGGSLYSRMEYVSNGLEALAENPLGLGFTLQQISDPLSSLKGYARENYFEEHNLSFSGDSFFLWLLVQLGLIFGAAYFLLFLVPIIYGWRLKNAIQDKNLRIIFHGILALLIITVIGGISNSPILVFPPSNLFIWAAVGLLFKIPSWDRESINVDIAPL
jgi:hypothetical protein